MMVVFTLWYCIHRRLFFLHWKYVVNFECPHALLIGVVCRPITSSFRGLFLCGVFAQPFTAALIGVVISYCVALASGVFLDLAFQRRFLTFIWSSDRMVYLMLLIGDVLFLYISFAYARSLFPFIFCGSTHTPLIGVVSYHILIS